MFSGPKILGLNLLILVSIPGMNAQNKIYDWLVCGPFEGAKSELFERQFINELELRPDQQMVSAGKNWELCKTDKAGVIDFNENIISLEIKPNEIVTLGILF